MTENKISFHDYLVTSASKTNSKAAILSFLKYKREDVQEHEITNTWLLRFKDYLEEKDLSANSRAKYIKTLQSIIRKAKSRGYNLPVVLDDVRNEMSIQAEASESVYLNRDELKLIENYVPKGTGEKFTRAIFLICAYTGCRISDAQLLTVNNFNDGEVNYTSKKTKSTSRLPLHPLVPELVKAINGNTYDEFSIKAIVGRDIKTICKKLGINKEVTLYRRGERMTKPKWAMLSSHTARKSFATNMLIDGYSLEAIARMMNHKDTKMTLAYVCMSYSDAITGDKTYLRPYANDLYDKLVKMVELGLSVEQACSTLAITGTTPAQIEHAKQLYENREKVLS